LYAKEATMSQAARSIHKELKESIPLSRSETVLLKHCLFSSALAIAAYYLFQSSTFVGFALSQVLLCAFYFRSFALMHDASHGSISSLRFLNHAVGIVAGAFCLLPYYPWKNLHIDHHQWAGNIEKDPVMKIVKEFPQYSRSKKMFFNFFWRTWIPFPAFAQNILFWTESIKRIFKTQSFKAHLLNGLSILIPTILYSLFFMQMGWSLFLFCAPSFVIYLSLVEIVNFPHHLQVTQISNDSKLPFKEQYKIARSCHYPKILSHFVFNNFNYHIEHHMFPHMPWYSLKAVRDQVKNYLGESYNESQANAWITKHRKIQFEKVIATKDDQKKAA
jgi:acyl-lipid omega-6 desaturase (Delta-12 desaturase)